MTCPKCGREALCTFTYPQSEQWECLDCPHTFYVHRVTRQIIPVTHIREELTELERDVLNFCIAHGDPGLHEVMAEFELSDVEARAVLKSIGRKRPRDTGETK